MGRPVLALLATAMWTLTGAVAAQSLEKTYASLCSDAAAKKGETCTALRKAMLEKLNAESGIPAQQPATAAGAAAKAEAGRPASPVRRTAQERWGPFYDLPKEPRANLLVDSRVEISAASLEILKFAWEIPDQVMSMSSTTADGSLKKLSTIRWDETRGALIDRDVESGAEVAWLPQPNGALVAQDDKVRIVMSRTPDGSTERRMEVDRGKGWELRFQTSYVIFSPESLPVLRSIHANSIERSKVVASIDPKYFDPEVQRQIAAREAARAQAEDDDDSSGILGSLVGAALGVAAGRAHGLDASQTLGAAMKGAQLMNPGSQAAAAFGSVGEDLIKGNGAASVSGGGRATAGGGAYPTKPNLAAGSCPGFTEGNYRTKALEGGKDVQLKTMCGQAFEYYTMYKRAIAQGYSEADANRTYAAHQGAVTNIRAFVGN